MKKKVVLTLLLLALLLPVAAWAQDVTPEASGAVSLAGKVIVIAGMVAAIVQGIKKLINLSGVGAMVLNGIASVVALIAVTPADQLFTIQTLIALITTILGAAGIHSLLRPKP
jgi:hypothetical protein